MINYNSNIMGYLTIKQKDNKYRIQIRQGNCLAIFISVTENPDAKGGDGKYLHTLYNFFVDASHLKRIIKNHDGDVFGDKVVKLELNTRYKETSTMLPLLTQAGYKVTCYYK